MRERVRESIDPSARLVDNLRKVITVVFSMFGEHFSFLLTTSNFQAMNFNTESLWKQNKELVSHFRESGNEIQNALISIFALGRKSGELVTPLDDTTLARYLGSLVRGILFDWRVEGRMGDIRKEIEALILFMTKGIETT